MVRDNGRDCAEERCAAVEVACGGAVRVVDVDFARSVRGNDLHRAISIQICHAETLLAASVYELGPAGVERRVVVGEERLPVLTDIAEVIGHAQPYREGVLVRVGRRNSLSRPRKQPRDRRQRKRAEVPVDRSGPGTSGEGCEQLCQRFQSRRISKLVGERSRPPRRGEPTDGNGWIGNGIKGHEPGRGLDSRLRGDCAGGHAAHSRMQIHAAVAKVLVPADLRIVRRARPGRVLGEHVFGRQRE